MIYKKSSYLMKFCFPKYSEGRELHGYKQNDLTGSFYSSLGCQVCKNHVPGSSILFKDTKLSNEYTWHSR